MKHFICTSQFSGEQVYAMLQYAIAQKAQAKAGRLAPTLSRKTLAMVFEKPSLRTRVSFEVGMSQLGGHAINLDQKDIGIGKRESVEDRRAGSRADGMATASWPARSPRRRSTSWRSIRANR